MPDPDDQPMSPEKMALILFVTQVLALGAMAFAGVLHRLPPILQFLLGAEAFGFPILVYFFLKKRRERGE